MIEPGESLPPRVIWSVASLVHAVADALAARFSACTVAGELSGFTRASSGHCYFTLKDGDGESASLRCAMFKRAGSLLQFLPADGQQVQLRGRLAVYEPRGELQFIVESMQRSGEGALYEKFLQLKRKLELEGLFDASRKRPLDPFPRRVGVVTSLSAAALHDVITSLQRRSPQVAVIVYPSLVQGAQAPEALVAAIVRVGLRREVDTLIVCRGGGSLEDLWAFNEAVVVRAIAACPVPVIVGVGHETDLTLADLAADLRAPTPTAAAELAAPVRDELLQALAMWASRARRGLLQQLDVRAQRLDRVAWRVARPAQALASHRGRLDLLAQGRRNAMARISERSRERQTLLALRCDQALGQTLERMRQRADLMAARLQALDPIRVIGRGYALIQTQTADIVVDPRQLAAGQDLKVTLAHGTVGLRVDRILPP